MKRNIQLWTDGGAAPNPGPGSSSYIIILDGQKYTNVQYGGPVVTNNQMELKAVIYGLKHLLVLEEDNYEKLEVTVYCDSAYVVNGAIHPNRLIKWAQNGYRKTDGSPLANKELWESLFNILMNKKLVVKFEKVKAHSGIPLNEECDSMATLETILCRPN